jgi:hypothetical protein
MKRFIYCIILCSLAWNVSSQKDPEKLKLKIDSLKKLGRDSLIKLAITKENKPGFEAKGYDRIVVKAYKDKLEVDFSLSVKLVDGSCFYDHVSVSLVGHGSGRSIQGDCEEPKYHQFTEKRKKKIQFVFDAINKDNEVGDLKDNKVSAGSHMTITEKLRYYYVENSSYSTYSHYKVDKITGNISDANHKHYAHSTDDKDEFEVIR